MPNFKRDGVPVEGNCPKCGSDLVMRFGRYGAFIGCTNYRAEPPCDYTRDLNVPAGSEPSTGTGEDEAPIPPCEKCGKPMALKRSRFGVFLGCTGYPDCKNIRKIGPQAAPPKDTGVQCPECKQGTILEKKSRRGKIFFSCSRYPDCKFALWNKPVATPCPKCAYPLLTEKTTKRRGTELVCPNEECDYTSPVKGGGAEPASGA
jgi:DNA topoisomerase-1